MNVPHEYLNVYTTKKQAEQINKIILTYVDKNSIITDATSCVGGNSVFFARDFFKVICIEKNHDVFKILKKNTCKYNNCICYNTSYNYVKNIIRQDVIFIDPPWGGNEYKSKEKIKLYLDNVEIQNIINTLYNHASIIVLKVPSNFDMESLNNLFWSYNVHCITKYNKPIYNIIVFNKYI
tara:strand:- start:481 stop:1020 length:540 start_codon:yes stop_codon:yes gene_type:complete